jgi:sec-independent protein translocase protein TatA
MYGGSLMIIGIGYQELLIILIIVLVLFGATKVPQLMRGIGQGVKEFKSAVGDEEDKKDESEQKKAEPKEEK